MDEFADRLKRDALEIDAEVPAELRRRIDAGLRTTRRAAPRGAARRSRSLPGYSSAAAGLAVAAVVLYLLNRPPQEPDAPPAVATPPAAVPLLSEPLNLETVNLAGPLQLELERLRADLEKARDAIERDLRSSL